MLLSDGEIRDRILEGTLGIFPYVDQQLQPASYDVRLASGLLMHDGVTPIDTALDSRAAFETVTMEEGGYWLPPRGFVLGSTIEAFVFPADLSGRLDGKSSLGRLGIVCHVTAGFFDPGFRGTATLEIVNLNLVPVRLYPGMPIAQMSFWRMGMPSRMPYRGKYQDQQATTASAYHENLATVED